MEKSPAKTVLCIASYEKGHEFIRECKRQGWTVLLLTAHHLEHANWPRESIDEVFLLPDLYKRNDVIHSVSFIGRTHRIDRIVALDDYDVEMAATLREHLRVAGMGETTARYFRDKLAMRVGARQAGLRVPDFVHVLNYDNLREFMASIAPPWILKPRSEASSVGLKKVHTADELWGHLETLGDRQSYFVLERFVAGDIFHVDSIISEKKVIFAEAHEYGAPPMSVVHEGGIYTTRTLLRDSPVAHALKSLNEQVLAALGLARGISHVEFIKGSDDAQFYFLEAAARVGGANIVEMIEAATEINLWAEWAKIETTPSPNDYRLPETRADYAGTIISLAKQEHPDTSAYQDAEIYLRLNKRHHAGFVIRSPQRERVIQLLDEYSTRFYQDFHTSLPPSDKPVD